MRSGSDNRPRAYALALCLAVAACSATSPRPLPPRRVVFGPAAAAPLPPPDLPHRPTVPPVRTERYLGWTLAADFAGIVPLTAWIGRPEDVYLVLPSLLLPPLIHAVHGEGGRALGSLFMRMAMVGGVYLAGRSAEAECADTKAIVCIPFGSMLLAELVVVPVVVIDSLVLARRVRPDSAWRKLPLAPSVQAGPGGQLSLGLGAQF